jgi:hypothetical protein
MQTVQSELTAADHRNRQANKKISRQANRIQWLLTQRKMSLLALEKNAAQVKQLQCIANRIKLKGTISLSRPLDTFDAGRGSFDPQNSAHRKQKSRASIRAVQTILEAAGRSELRAAEIIEAVLNHKCIQQSWAINPQGAAPLNPQHLQVRAVFFRRAGPAARIGPGPAQQGSCYCCLVINLIVIHAYTYTYTQQRLLCVLLTTATPSAARALGAPAVHCRECSGLCARPLGPLGPALAAGRAGCVGVGISTCNTEKVAYSR